MFFLFFKQRGTIAIPFANPARLSIFGKQNRKSLRKTTLTFANYRVNLILSNEFIIEVMAKKTHKCV